MAGRASRNKRAVVAILAVACVGAIALALSSTEDDGDTGPDPAVRARYADIPKIDVHVHVPPARAREAHEIFLAHGVALALNASGGQPGEALDQTLRASHENGDALPPYCNLSWMRVLREGEPYAREALTRCKRDGAIGLKIFKSLGLGIGLSDGTLLRIDDERLDSAFDIAGELSLPVLIHSGDPQAFFRPPTEDNERFAELSAHPSWSFYGARPDGAGVWPSWEEVFDQYERRVARHPHTTFVGAHFGNAPEEPERVSRMLDRYPNLVVETGARIPEIGRQPPDRLRAIFLRHRTRILFGTDTQLGSDGSWILGSAGSEPDPPSRIPAFYEAHWRFFETADRGFAHPSPIQGDWTIDGIHLPRDVLEDLYHRNAERIFGLTLP